MPHQMREIEGSSRTGRFVGWGMLAALLVGGAVFVLDDGDPGRGVEVSAAAEGAPEDPRAERAEDWCEPSVSRPAEPTAEEIREANDALARQLAFELDTGWARVSNRHVDTDETVCGYTPAMGTTYEDVSAAVASAEAQPHGLPVTPVYDSVEGRLIGNIYGGRAFVPVDVASQPGVDIAALVD